VSQTALPFACETHVDAASMDAVGFHIGWDHARYHLVPPAEHLHEGHPVRAGWQAGRAVFRRRPLASTLAVRQWLQLRLQAWHDGDAFEDLQVTPHLMAQLMPSHCPVTLQPLAEGDGHVVRVFEGAGYAAGNLVVLSERAAAAKQHRLWRDALDIAQRLADGPAGATADGLSAAEWQRLGVLMSLATPLPHAQVAALPLHVLPPNRLRVLNPVQALQTLLTLLFTRPGYARQLADLAAALPAPSQRQAFQVFMHTMLARRVAAGPQADAAALREALQQAWSHPLVARRWQRLALALPAAECERLLRYAERRGLLPAGCRWLETDAATEGWALQRAGVAGSEEAAAAQAALPRRAQRQAAGRPALPPRVPGASHQGAPR
jgi:hypothetical protein